MNSFSFRQMTRRQLGGFLFCAGLLMSIWPTTQAATVIADGELDVPYVQTPDSVAQAMLDLAQVTANDYVVDLGSGDGRLLIAAAQRGAEGFGVDIDPHLVALANENARRAGVASRARFLEQDVYKTDMSPANVVLVYLLPAVNRQLLPSVLALKPGTRIVSHDYGFGDWQPDRALTVDAPNKPVNAIKKSDLLFWVVPAQVAGRWQGQSERGPWVLELEQKFQFVTGRLVLEGKSLPITTGRLTGSQLVVEAGQGGDVIALNVVLEGGQMNGQARQNGRAFPWQGTNTP